MKQVEKLENKLLEARNSKAMPSSHEADHNGAVETERLRKEVESLKNMIKEEKENAQAFNLKERAFFEAKLKEKADELMESEKQASIHKRKYQKLCEEVQDLQRLCDDSKARNRELEKTQQKFDADLNAWKAKLDAERELRERVERERDSVKYELFTAKADLENQKLEMGYLSEKLQRVEKDLREYEALSASSSCTNLSSSNNNQNVPSTVSSTSSNAILSSMASTASTADQFVKMKSMMRAMESKLRDQEEELDDQQGTIQQLEQAKLRLEMQIEKEKTKWQREIAEKESEMDDLRFHTQKKIKAIEMQLEEESELSSGLQREKRELERKLRELMANSGRKICGLGESGNVVNSEVAEYISKLKRLLLKYKTLAIDSQTQLESVRESIPKQSILKTLKSQLEDSEINKANALKSKQVLQAEIVDLMQQLEEANLARLHLEEQTIGQSREISNLKCQLDEQERETDDLLKKYQTHVQSYSVDSHKILDLSEQIDTMSVENRMLKDQIRELEEKVSFYENEWIDKAQVGKLESKLRDLECKYELECSLKTRLQVKQIFLFKIWIHLDLDRFSFL